MELYDLDKAFERMIKEFPQMRRELVENAGEKMERQVRANIKATVKPHTGKLEKAVMRVIGEGGGYAAVKPDHATAPHTHLVENGHEQVSGKGRSRTHKGWVAGKHMYRNALNQLAEELEQDAERTLRELAGDVFD